MTEAHFTNKQVEENQRERNLAFTVDTLGFGLFLIWIGVAFWIELVGWGLVGAGAITLGDQVARKCLRIKVEGNWVFVGVLLVCAGFGQIGLEFSLLPLLLIVGGVGVLMSLLKSRAK